MIALTTLFAIYLSMFHADPFPDATAIQFYESPITAGTPDLWTSENGVWSSVLTPGKTQLAPADEAKYKVCDLYIKQSWSNIIVLRALASNPPVPQNELKNPVLFVEGLDFFDEMPSTPGNSDPGTSASEFFTILENLGVTEPLVRGGHEILTLNFQHSSADIFQNGARTALVYSWIAQHSATNAPGLKVVGTSMGGLIARWGAYVFQFYRTAAQKPVGLYISVDAPHQGANIPLGLQSMVSDLAYMAQYVSSDPSSVGTLNTLLKNSMAVKQMSLRHNQSTSPNNEYTLFQMGYQQCKILAGTRQVAISNGSLVGAEQEYLPWDGVSVGATKQRFRTNANSWFKPLSATVSGNAKLFRVNRRADVEVDWIPGNLTAYHMDISSGLDQVSPSADVQLYSKYPGTVNSLSITHTPKWNANIPYDLAPGGYLNFFSMISADLNAYLDKADVDIPKAGNVQWYGPQQLDNYIEVGHACFVPTVSAIDYYKTPGNPAILDKSMVFANLKALDPLIARHTSFDAVYGVDDRSLSATRAGEDGGLWKNQFHVTGLSEENVYRIVCEVDFADGKIPSADVCSDWRNSAELQQKIWRTIDLRGTNGAPIWTHVTTVNDRVTFPSNSNEFISKHQDALVYQGLPATGWKPVYTLPYLLQAGDVASVDIYIPPSKYSYLTATAVLKGADDGCGWYQFGETGFNTKVGGWQTLTWTVPSYYVPECGKIGKKASLQLILNSPQATAPLMITGIRLQRNGGDVSTAPTLPPAEPQIIPLDDNSSFGLGGWGTTDPDYLGQGILRVTMNKPWAGAVLYNNNGLNVTDYTWLEVEAKGSVAADRSGMMIFFDDHPNLTPEGIDAWTDPGTTINPYGHTYNYWASMELVSTSSDGYETRRIPLSYLTPNLTLGKVLIQHASWSGKASNEIWDIRSMKFVK